MKPISPFYLFAILFSCLILLPLTVFSQINKLQDGKIAAVPLSGGLNKNDKLISEISVFGNICINNYLGRLAGESSAKGNFGFNFGIQAGLKDKYSVFISDDYVLYKYKESPNGDHIYRISGYNIGLKYRFSELEGKQKFSARIGVGPYFYERNKDDNGNWELNVDEVCFGGSLGVNCDVPLADFLSLSIDPVFHSFKTKDKSWLSFFSISAGLRLYVKV